MKAATTQRLSKLETQATVTRSNRTLDDFYDDIARYEETGEPMNLASFYDDELLQEIAQ